MRNNNSNKNEMIQNFINKRIYPINVFYDARIVSGLISRNDARGYIRRALYDSKYATIPEFKTVIFNEFDQMVTIRDEYLLPSNTIHIETDTGALIINTKCLQREQSSNIYIYNNIVLRPFYTQKELEYIKKAVQCRSMRGKLR